MNRRFAGALGALSLGVVSLLGSGSVAQAQERDSGPAGEVGVAFDGCLKGDFCLFQHDNFDGKQFSTSSNISWLAGFSFDNAASSMINGASREVEVFQLMNHAGTKYVARAKSSDKDFTDNGFDNKASSLRFR